MAAMSFSEQAGVVFQPAVGYGKEIFFCCWEYLIENRTVAAIAVLVLFLFLRFLKGYLTGAVIQQLRHLRGIRLEAMVEGSAFVTENTPSYQIPIYKVGMIFDSFVGYGVRVEDYLVIPTHVVKAAGGKIMFVAGTEKIAITSAPIPSRIWNDLSYYPIQTCTWASLGVSKAGKPVSVDKATAAKCTGQQGASVGLLKRADIFVGAMEYRGSTMPGMSGAAYTINSRFAGIHSGAYGTKNVGISATTICKEILKISTAPFKGEDSDFAVTNAPDHMDEYEEDFDRLEDRVLREVWDVDDEWTKDFKVDYGKTLDWGDLLDKDKSVFDRWEDEPDDELYQKESAPQFMISIGDNEFVPLTERQVLFMAAQKIKARRGRPTKKPVVKMQGHSDDPVEVDLADSAYVTSLKTLHSGMDRMHVRVKHLEEKYEKLTAEVVKTKTTLEERFASAARVRGTGHINPTKMIQCGMQGCNKWFATDMALQAHRLTSPVHIPVQEKAEMVTGESAFKHDNIKTVKTGKMPAFLAKSQAKKSLKNSGKTSPTSVKPDQFQSLLESQLKMTALMSQLVQRLDQPHKDMAGPSSVAMQK